MSFSEGDVVDVVAGVHQGEQGRVVAVARTGLHPITVQLSGNRIGFHSSQLRQVSRAAIRRPYMLFVYPAHHRTDTDGSGGGFMDHYNDFDMLADAISAGREATQGGEPHSGQPYYWHVVDLVTRKRVAGNDR